MKQTNAMWYLIALLLVLGGWVAAAAIAASDWDQLKTSEITPINPGKKVDVTEKGVAFFTDFKQDREITCRSDPAKALTIEDNTFELQSTSGERVWHLVGISKDAKAGSYKVACTPKDRVADTATYGYTALPEFQKASTGKGVGSMTTLAAAILAAWCWWGRRAQRVV